MNQFAIKNTKISRFLFEYGNLVLALISVIALLSTFIVAISETSLNTKIVAFASIVTGYFSVYVVLHTMQKNQVVEFRDVSNRNSSQQMFKADTDEKLLVLEEAGKFFGASLKTIDMHRLLSSRISEIIPYQTCAFFQINRGNKFTVPFATGENARLLEGVNIDCSLGIAGRALLSGEIECDKNLSFEKMWIEDDFLSGLGSAMAIPLYQDEEIFCVLVLYSENKNNYLDKHKVLAEAVGERITPLIRGSIAFEKSLSNALTDNLTNLPNERAFYLILENQVAEAQRFLDRRSLTVLAVDIISFNEINEKYGHSMGDNILAFTAETIKGQIRDMDFLARTVKDEFLIVLPTATEEITKQIIQRIKNAFKENPFPVSSYQNCYVKLSYGSATFLDDGETANELLNKALIRKQQAKPNSNNSVVFFPRRIAN